MSPNGKERIEILRALKKRVLKHHFNVAGVDHAVWARRVDERTPALLSCAREQFESGVRELVAQLGSSHTLFYHERTNYFSPQHTINATLRSFRIDDVDRWVFMDVFEAGPAHKAGIRPGDMLVALDSNVCEPPRLPPFQLGRTFELRTSTVHGDGVRNVLFDVPFRKGTKERPPIVEPTSPIHRMIDHGIGLLKIPYFPDPTGLGFAKALDGAVEEMKHQGCDRLIIDLRGNIGGSLGFARLASYLCPGKIPIGHSLTPARLRAGYSLGTLPNVSMPATKAALFLTLAHYAFRDKSVVLLTQGLGPQPFHGNIVVLINEFTNSAGEMVASFAKENGLATVVGTATAGNVLGAVNFRLGGGYLVRLPVFGWYTSHATCLEGTGVSPDIRIDPDPILLGQSLDPQFEVALKILGGKATCHHEGRTLP